MPSIVLPDESELDAIREGVAAFIKAEVIPRHVADPRLNIPTEKYDSSGAYRPWVRDEIKAVRKAAAAAGFYTMSVPESLGGGGLGYLAYFVAWEQVFRQCGAHHWLGQYVISHWAKGPSLILEHTTEELRCAVLPELMTGRQSICFALSEPEAGSDAAMIKTRAVPDGNGWRINGSKIWITNSPYADHVLVFAVTDPEQASNRRGGISAFLIPTATPGFKVESLINMWGHTGTDEGILVFDNVRAEQSQLVGELHKGFKLAMAGVGMGRLYNAAWGIGAGRWALGLALEHAKTRKTFGKPLSDYQGITFPLAESAAELHAAHLVAINVARLLDAGLPATKELSMAKLCAVDAGMKAVDRAMQTHGAMGFTNEMHLTEAYIYLRKVCVADGSREILRHVISKQLFAGDTDV